MGEPADLIAVVCNLLLKAALILEKWKAANMMTGLKRAFSYPVDKKV